MYTLLFAYTNLQYLISDKYIWERDKIKHMPNSFNNISLSKKSFDFYFTYINIIILFMKKNYYIYICKIKIKTLCSSEKLHNFKIYFIFNTFISNCIFIIPFSFIAAPLK